MNSLIIWFARKPLFGDLFTVFVIGAGLVSLAAIQRDVFPNVNFDVISVTAIFPGASPEEVEKLIANPLEQDLGEVDGIKKLKSTAIEGRLLILAQLDSDQTTEAKAKADIQEVVDRFQKPDGVDDILVTSLETKQSPIIEVNVVANLSDLELRDLAKKAERRIEALPGVARVVARGLRDREFHVKADPGQLARYRLSLDDLSAALRRQNLSIPAGNIDPRGPEEFERIVRTVGEFAGQADIENTVIRANELGEAIRVRDVAVVEKNLERATILHRTHGERSIGLTVLKKEKSDAIKMVEAVKVEIERLKAEYQGRATFNYVNDFSYFIKRRLSILGGNLALGLFIVFGLLALLLPIRVTLLVSIGVPFAFLGAMIIFKLGNQTINLISLMGLIIVSGMLVDDAIVVTDNAVRHMENGLPPEEAAIRGVTEVWAPVTASVLTTIFAFLPMMFMSGIFGKFIWQIPLGVICALGVSLFEAFFILPGHIAKYIRVAKKGSTERKRGGPLGSFLQWTEKVWDERVVPRYIAYLEMALRRRYLVGVAVGLVFFGSLGFAAMKMKFVLFPADGIEIFFARGDAPLGTPIERTAALMKPVEDEIAKLSKMELDEFTTIVGIQQQDQNDPTTRRGSEYAQIAVYLTPETARSRSAEAIIEELRAKLGTPPGLIKLSFARVNSGPPTGKPVDLSVSAEEYETIVPAVEDLKKRMAAIAGVRDVNDSYVLGKEEYRISVQGPEAAAAGLSVAQIGNTVRAAFEGTVATQIQELGEEVAVRVSLSDQARRERGTIDSIQIPNQMGNLIPLSRVATVSKAQGAATLQHRQGKREIRVTADIDDKVTSSQLANAAVEKFMPDFKVKYPMVTVTAGGEDEDTKESMASLGRAFVIAFALIFLVLIATFQNLTQPLLVLLTIPMGIISVIWAFYLHGRPLSFLAMIGIIALAGVIVNNAIVLVDFVNQERARGVGKMESILNSARVRVRPIFLTTVTTVAGLMPTAYGIGGLDPFVVPIALSLGWGLAIGSLLTAGVFPVAIALLDDVVGFVTRTGKRVYSR